MRCNGLELEHQEPHHKPDDGPPRQHIDHAQPLNVGWRHLGEPTNGQA